MSQQKSEGLGTIWLAAVGGRAERVRALAQERLREVGFDARTLDQEPPPGPEIVFFDSAEQSLCDLLRELSRSDGTCLLAVAADPRSLREGNAWRLACAGASDVFSYDKSEQWATRVIARV